MVGEGELAITWQRVSATRATTAPTESASRAFNVRSTLPTSRSLTQGPPRPEEAEPSSQSRKGHTMLWAFTQRDTSSLGACGHPKFDLFRRRCLRR